MWTRSSICLMVAVLCVGTVLAPRPVQAMLGDIVVTAVGEPNDPNGLAVSPDPNQGWNPAASLAATWESVTKTSRLYNPIVAKLPERSLSISARADIFSIKGLLGFDTSARGLVVLDEKGGEIYRQAALSGFSHFYRSLRSLQMMSPFMTSAPGLPPYSLTVGVPCDPNQPYPLLFSRVEWSVYALSSTETKTVDIPFRPTADWLPLTPDLEIKVEEATTDGTKYQYRLATRYSHSKVAWTSTGTLSVRSDGPMPEVMLTGLTVLDPQGRSIQDQGGSGGFSSSSSASGSGDLMTGTTSGTGSCSICGTATTFRFTLAFNLRQQELRVVLENVPVPVF